MRNKPLEYPSVLLMFWIALIEDDWCPNCLGSLDEGRECNRCNFDAMEVLDEHDQRSYRRERE